MRSPAWTVVGAVALAAGGLSACDTQGPTAEVTTAPTATTATATATATAGVPVGVLDVVAQLRAVPGNRAIGPGQWVRTTYGAYRRTVGGLDPSGTAAPQGSAADAAEVYVVQLGGDFAPLEPTTAGRRYRFTVIVTPSELPMSAAEAVRQSDRPLPLADLGTVSTFPLP